MKKEETYKCIKDTPTGSYKAGVIDNSPLCELLPEYFGKYLGVTNNGSDVYAGDKLWQIRKDGFSIHPCCVEQMNKAYYNYFDSYESAKAHIDEKNKPKFEAGKVYKTDFLGGSLFFCTEFSNGAGKGYGFEDGKWISETGSTFYWSFRDDKNPAEATPAEWEAALIKEAQNRFPINTRFLALNNHEFVSSGTFQYADNILFNLGINHGNLFGSVFSCGKWASIIQEPEREKTTNDYLEDLAGHNGLLKESVRRFLATNNLIITKKPKQ